MRDALPREPSRPARRLLLIVVEGGVQCRAVYALSFREHLESGRPSIGSPVEAIDSAEHEILVSAYRLTVGSGWLGR